MPLSNVIDIMRFTKNSFESGRKLHLKLKVTLIQMRELDLRHQQHLMFQQQRQQLRQHSPQQQQPCQQVRRLLPNSNLYRTIINLIYVS